MKKIKTGWSWQTAVLAVFMAFASSSVLAMSSGVLVTTYTATVNKFALNPLNAELYASTSAGVMVINTSTLAAVTIPVAGAPMGMAVSADGTRLYVAISSLPQLAVIDLSSRTVLAPISLPYTPFDVEVGNNGRIYVTPGNIGGYRGILQIDSATGLVMTETNASDPVFIYYNGMLEISADRNTLYFANAGISPGTLAKYDVSTGTPVLLYENPHGSLGSNGQDLALTANNDYIYYAVGGGNQNYDIARIRTSDMSIQGLLATGPYPEEVTTSQNGQTAYTVHTTGLIDVWNTETQTQTTVYGTNGNGKPSELVLAGSGNYLFAALPTHLYVYSAEGNTLTDTDGDTVIDGIDNCPLVASIDQTNSDGDALGNVCDMFPYNSTETLDNDNDGIGNNADTDDDNDSIPDVSDAFPFVALDTDNDGMPDVLVGGVPSPEGFESNNFSGRPWVMGGTAPWTINSATKHSGAYSARSGVITHSQTSSLEVTHSTTSTVSFWLSTSSESGYDYLQFYVDGVLANSWSGTVAWQQYTKAVTAGLHVLKWVYSKDGSVSTGSDAVWIDDINFGAGGIIEDTDDDNDGILDVSDNCTVIVNASQINTDGVADGGDACDSDDDNDGMPDTWETTYGLNPLVNDASGDIDGDGITNKTEFDNGTDPAVANAVSKVKNDYNNDGIAGWIWKGQSNGVETQSQSWQLTFPLYSPNWAVPNRFYHPVFPDQANWELVTSGDFNKDGDADILWRHLTLASWKVWQMQDGLRVAQNTPADFDLAHEWQVIGAGDTDKDGDDDVILNNATTGDVLIWEMQNHAIANTHSVGTKAGYTLNRVGDFNKDGDVDLLFRQNSADVLITWELQANAFVTERALANTGTSYSPVCTGDFDNDGDDDIMLVNSTTQQEKWFIMENYSRTQTTGSTNVGFVFRGCGDYDGDGDADMLWQRSSDSANRVILQQNYGATKQTVYTNAFGGVNGFVYRGNSN